MTARLDAYDQFTTIQGSNPFKDVSTWHDWETGQLLLHVNTAKPEASLFPPDKGALFQRGKNNKLITLSKSFSLSVTSEGMKVVGTDPVIFTLFPFSKMQSMIINAKNTIEFYHDDELYRIRLERRSSSLKYVELFHMLACGQERKEETL